MADLTEKEVHTMMNMFSQSNVASGFDTAKIMALKDAALRGAKSGADKLEETRKAAITSLANALKTIAPDECESIMKKVNASEEAFEDFLHRLKEPEDQKVGAIHSASIHQQ